MEDKKLQEKLQQSLTQWHEIENARTKKSQGFIIAMQKPDKQKRPIKRNLLIIEGK